MAAINNVATADTYTVPATLTCFPTARITTQVLNAGVFYQLNLNSVGTRAVAGGGTWTEERQLMPGYWSFDAEDFREFICTGIRFRSAVTGVPAFVTASD